MRLASVALAAVIALAGATAVRAEEPDTFTLTIKDHRFTPDRVEVPTGRKITLVIRNEDGTPEEFESKDLRREKVVAPGKQIQVFVGPLTAGEYKFEGEYNSKTAKGVLVAK